MTIDLISEDTLDDRLKKSTESTATKSDVKEEKSIWSGPAKLPDEKSRSVIVVNFCLVCS